MENSKELNTMRNSAFLYDYDNRDNLTADIPFYLSYGEYAKNSVLELGCGTGRVSLVLAENGYEVTGLDLSDSMLAVFRRKLEECSEQVRGRISLVKGDMTRFSLNKKYGLIISPFRAFQSLITQEDIINSLECIWEHLAENGVFIMNVFRPYGVLDENWVYPERVQWERKDDNTGINIVKKHWGEKIDVVNQIIYPHFAYEVIYPDERFERIEDSFALKYYYYEQLKDLLTDNGFSIQNEYGWYDKSDIKGGRELIFVCKKSVN